MKGQPWIIYFFKGVFGYKLLFKQKPEEPFTALDVITERTGGKKLTGFTMALTNILLKAKNILNSCRFQGYSFLLKPLNYQITNAFKAYIGFFGNTVF
jgi:hypothetical protein